MKKYKVIFFGTPEFAVPVLEKLIKDERFQVDAVVTEPDRKSGRGKKVVCSSVKRFVEDYNMRLLRPELVERARNDGREKIEILQPIKIKNLKLKIENLQPDVVVVCAYGQFIPKEILDIPKFGFVNIHPSLLPKYRGPSPIQTAILNGDRETGVTIIKVDEKMDHGALLGISNFQFPISKQISNLKFQNSKLNSFELSQILSKLGAELLIKIFPDYLEGKIKPKPQDHAKATFTKLINKVDGLINWNEPVEKIERKIRAYFPWPGTYTFLGNKRLKILKAHLKKSTSVTPEVEEVDNKLVLDMVQVEGKKPISWEEFKRGYRQKIYPEYFRGVDISDKIMV